MVIQGWKDHARHRTVAILIELEVAVWAEHPEDAAWACPHCSKTVTLYDHAEEQAWGIL
jgi:hypothetical protein